MKHVILINPEAGRKKGIKYGHRVQKLLNKHNIQASMYISKEPLDLKKYVAETVKTQTCRFYSIGGDGTLNEIISSLINTTSELVVLASGTGNDFVRSISNYRSLRKIINHSVVTKASKVDSMIINNSIYCVNILSVGFDGMVGKNVEKFKWIPLISGSSKYNLAILYTLFANQNYNLKIRMDGTKIYKDTFTLLTISNGKYYGGGIVPNPYAKFDDGLLNSCLIKSTSILTKLHLLPKYKKGDHENIDLVTFNKLKKITVVSNKTFPVNIDGEITYMKKLKCEILPNSLNIIINQH